jgi:hypothetical protein
VILRTKGDLKQAIAITIRVRRPQYPHLSCEPILNTCILNFNERCVWTAASFHMLQSILTFILLLVDNTRPISGTNPSCCFCTHITIRFWNHGFVHEVMWSSSVSHVYRVSICLTGNRRIIISYFDE